MKSMEFGSVLFKKKLLKNFSYAFIFQGSNYILPLLTIPYLVRVLGPEKFGLVVFAQALTQFFILITDYGFILSAPKKIAINRGDTTKITQIYSSVFLIKLILTFVCFFVLTIIVFTIPKLRTDVMIYFLSYLLVIGNLLLPVWFFQGVEQIKYISILNISAKIIYVVSIFLFVKVQSDYIFVPIFNGMSIIVTGLLSFWIIRKYFGVKIVVPPTICLYEEIKDGWHMFTSMLSVSIYSTSNVIILGFVTSSSIVGYFRVVEILTRNLSTALMQPVTQVLYPYISRFIITSKAEALKLSTRVIVVIGALNFILGILLFISSDTIIYFVFGQQYGNSIIVLKILSFLPFILGICGTVGPLILLPLNMNATVSRILFLTCLINLLISIPLSYHYHHIGASCAVLITELIASMVMLFVLKQKNVISVKDIFSR